MNEWTIFYIQIHGYDPGQRRGYFFFFFFFFFSLWGGVIIKLSLSFFLSLLVLFVSWNWMQPTRLRGWFPPLSALHYSNYCTKCALSCNCARLAFAWSVGTVHAILFKSPAPFSTWLWKPLFSHYKGKQNTQQDEEKDYRESVYSRCMDQQPK